MDDYKMQQGRFVGNLGGLVRVQVGDDEWEQAVLSIELGKESRISLTEAPNECTSSYETDIFYESPLRECTVMVPTDGWMDEAAESSHDFVICPSDTKHQRRRIRPAEGEDLDIWVSLMKDGGARLRLVKSIDNPPVTPRSNARARSASCPGSEAAAAASKQHQQHQQQQESKPHGGTGKDEDDWRLDAFFHSVWGGLVGAVGGKGNDDSRTEGDKEEVGNGEIGNGEESRSPAMSTPCSSPRHPSSRAAGGGKPLCGSPGSMADSVDSVTFMRPNPAYLLEEEPLHHGDEDGLPTRVDTCTLRAMLDSVSDEAAMQTPPGLDHQLQKQHDEDPRGGGALSSSMDLSLASDISLHNNSIFCSEDSCLGADASPLAMIPRKPLEALPVALEDLASRAPPDEARAAGPNEPDCPGRALLAPGDLY